MKRRSFITSALLMPAAFLIKPETISNRYAKQNCPSDDFVDSDYYRFENCVESRFNNHVVTKCKVVAENAGQLHNPLFISGFNATGKTFMLYSIKHHVQEKFPDKKIELIGEDGFVVSTLKYFIRKPRDVLLIDNFERRGFSQEYQKKLAELIQFYVNTNRQIVIASRRELDDLGLVSHEVKDCLKKGTIVNFDVLEDYEIMNAIKYKNKKEKLKLSEKIMVEIVKLSKGRHRKMEEYLELAKPGLI